MHVKSIPVKEFIRLINATAKALKEGWHVEAEYGNSILEHIGYRVELNAKGVAVVRQLVVAPEPADLAHGFDETAEAD